MVSADPTIPECPVGDSVLDHESTEWVQGLRDREPAYEETVARLHELLLRVARGEVRRRRGQLAIAGPELTTWPTRPPPTPWSRKWRRSPSSAVRAGSPLGPASSPSSRCRPRSAATSGRKPTAPMDAEDWDRLPDRFGLDPGRVAEWHDIVAALHRAVDDELTDHQRRIFVAIVLNGTPLDALVIELGSNRNAIYKAMPAARRLMLTARSPNSSSTSLVAFLQRWRLRPGFGREVRKTKERGRGR